MYHSLGENN
ncbi:hypothetical protein CP8484711_1745, partial [Chlamydia psittaci 84-8471/1]